MITIVPNISPDKHRRYVLNYRSENEPYEIELTRGRYLLECWGASGSLTESKFVRGSYVSGILAVEKHQKLYAYVGNAGSLNGAKTFNGGGKGSIQGNSGGGATDFRLKKGNFDLLESLLSRIIVAGAGAGLNQFSSDAHYQIHISNNFNGSGSGGSVSGSIGYIMECSSHIGYLLIQATGGNQANGGSFGYCPSYSDDCYHGQEDLKINASLGIGGDCVHATWGTGGGGGFFGGGAGGVNHCIVGSGGGGSSYVSGHHLCSSTVPNQSEKGYFVSESSVHYSKIKFQRPVMLSGEENISEPDGTIRTGHTGNGVARITFISPLETSIERLNMRIFFTLSFIFLDFKFRERKH